MKRKAATTDNDSTEPRRRSARLTTNERTFHSRDRSADESRATKRLRTLTPSAESDTSYSGGELVGELVGRRGRRQGRNGAQHLERRLSNPNADNTSSTERGLDLRFRPINDIRDIFHDLVEKACELGLGGSPLFDNRRPIRIATMCSGTESPLLACRLISEGIVFTFPSR